MATGRRRLALDLYLRPIPLSEARGLLAGRPRSTGPAWHPEFPLPDTVSGLRLLLFGYEAMGTPIGAEPPAWWLNQIVVDDEVVGDAGFSGAAVAGRVEIRYEVVPSLRGRGIATRACAALLDQAWAAGAEQALAEVVDPANEASRRVLVNNGFSPTGDGWFVCERPR